MIRDSSSSLYFVFLALSFVPFFLRFKSKSYDENFATSFSYYSYHNSWFDFVIERPQFAEYILVFLQFHLIVLRMVHFDNGGNWGFFWFTPAVLYFLFGAIFTVLCLLISILIFFFGIPSIHPSFNHKNLCIMSAVFAIECGLLVFIFIQNLIMFVRNYQNVQRFEDVRKTAVIILIIHLVFKFFSTFYRTKFMNHIYEA